MLGIGNKNTVEYNDLQKNNQFDKCFPANIIVSFFKYLFLWITIHFKDWHIIKFSFVYVLHIELYMDRQQWCCIREFLFWYIGAACSSGFKLNSHYVSACAIQFPWIYPRPVATTPLPWSLLRLVSSTVRDTCCAHGFKAPSEFPPPRASLLSPAYIGDETALSCTSTSLSLPISLFHFPSLPLSFLFPFDAPVSTTAAPLSAPLQTQPLCRWTYFTAPCKSTHTDTCTLTNRARAVEWSSCQGD